MVTCTMQTLWSVSAVSVLALSSRFDGLVATRLPDDPDRQFQYSLCRVVLMVACGVAHLPSATMFQYSLCRVVLMVAPVAAVWQEFIAVSVLALSSRFDGLHGYMTLRPCIPVSVLALSSRFDGR